MAQGLRTPPCPLKNKAVFRTLLSVRLTSQALQNTAKTSIKGHPDRKFSLQVPSVVSLDQISDCFHRAKVLPLAWDVLDRLATPRSWLRPLSTEGSPGTHWTTIIFRGLILTTIRQSSLICTDCLSTDHPRETHEKGHIGCLNEVFWPVVDLAF